MILLSSRPHEPTAPVARARQAIEDYCPVCKEPRDHRVLAVDAAGTILRVICGYCESQHNFRGNRCW